MLHLLIPHSQEIFPTMTICLICPDVISSGKMGCVVCCIDAPPEIEDNKVYSDRLKEILGEKPYFHGEKPGIIDVAVWSILDLHVKAGTHAMQVWFP